MVLGETVYDVAQFHGQVANNAGSSYTLRRLDLLAEQGTLRDLVVRGIRTTERCPR
jgi:hypothetical protein